MRSVHIFCLLFVIGWEVLTGNTQHSMAYDLPTHEAIATRAVDVSSLSVHFRNQLGFLSGVDEAFLRRSAKDWITFGAQSEDIPATRVRHHFHNPLRPWAQAGLKGQLGQSSLLWNQEPRQDSYCDRN